MTFQESELVELKAIVTEDIKLCSVNEKRLLHKASAGPSTGLTETLLVYLFYPFLTVPSRPQHFSR